MRTDRLRVAIFSDTFAPQMNGVTRTLGKLVSALEERGHATRVYAPSDPGATADERVVRRPSVPFWAYPELRLSAPWSGSVIADLRAWRPTLVHAATPFGIGLAGLGAARRLRVPAVSSYHTSLAEYAKFYGLGAISEPGWAYLRWFHNRTLRTYCPTEAISHELCAHGFRETRVWSRGVDADAFNPIWRSEQRRREWLAFPESVVVTYVGRLAEEKGIGVALDAMCRAAARSNDVVCVIVGDGPYEFEARRRAPPGTIFTGRLSGRALSEAYASSDVFLFPSTTDTFGNVLQEAMASGLAVIAADVPQTREVVGEEGGVFVSPTTSGEALAEQLHALLGDRPRRERLAMRARARAATRSWDAIFDDLFADYLSVSRPEPA